MQTDVTLPSFEHINTALGLKYLNGNKALYLKILNSFLSRYETLEIIMLSIDDLKSTMHTVKGLSSTLGMESLSLLARTIHDTPTIDNKLEFTKLLGMIIDELYDKLQTNTRSILIIDNITLNLDILVKGLGEKYDLLVNTSTQNSLKTLQREDISLVLINQTMLNSTEDSIYSYLKKEKIPIILLTESLPTNNIPCYDYIEQPLNIFNVQKSINSLFQTQGKH